MDIKKFFEDLAKQYALSELEQRVREEVQKLIAAFTVEATNRIEDYYQDFLIVSIRQNAPALDNDELSQLAGIVNAEVARRAAQ